MSAESQLYQQAKIDISRSLVSFLNVPTIPLAEFPCAGSGTLVRVGDVFGIVTAAHVTEVLKTLPQVGVVRYTGSRFQGLILSMQHVRLAEIGNPPWTQNGPDIAFVVLPYDSVQTLEAYGCVFLDLATRFTGLKNGNWDRKGFFCIAGCVGELTKSQGSTATHLKVDGNALIEVVDVGPHKKIAQFDYVDCVLLPNPGFPQPKSFEGMSGGGLFIAHVTTSENGIESVSLVTFAGVIFWQSDQSESGRIISCHFADSIYGPLVAEILNMNG
jgi:hypothetical protein